MFFKQIKYDLLFSRDAFLGMGGLLIGVAVVMSLITWQLGTAGFFGSVAFGVPFSMVITGVFVAFVIQLVSFYKKSLFENSGYLMLTIPVDRASLLISKIVAALFWVNYMALVGLIMMAIIAMGFDGINFNFSMSNVSARVIFQVVEGFIGMNFFPLLIITVTYFGITLKNSVIGGFRVNGLVAGFVCIAYLVFIFRFVYTMVVIIFSSYFDYFQSFRITYFFVFVFAVVAASATYYLLKHKVELR